MWGARAARALAWACAAVLLGACATPQADALRAAPGELAVAPVRELADVPYFAQEEHACGPATLAMVLAASGAPVQPADLVREVYVPGREGSLPPEMVAAARRHGRLALTLAPRLADILREVDAGHPVVVLQNLGLSWFTVWHYAVVVGYDLPRGTILLRSGPQAREEMPFTVFERTWARSNHWAMVALAPPQLPASAGMDELVQAAAALERVDAHAARGVYRAILERHPDSYGAWMGLGNSAMALGDVREAGQAFERATQVRPDAADAWNNLASAWVARHELARAREAIRRALELGGPHESIYRQTQREIEAAAGRPALE